MNEKNGTTAYFEENGFVALPQLLAEAEIAEVSDEIDRVITGAVDYVPQEAVLYEPNSSPPRVRNVFHIHRYNPFFMNIATHPKIVSVIEGILGRPVRLYSSHLFAKPAKVGTKVPLHQDMAHWSFEPYEMLSCWIALDDSTIENGCVRFLEGSHKFGMLHHVPTGMEGNSLEIQDERMDALKEYVMEVPRGSCVLHHCLTAHYSELNRSSHPRRGLIFVYMSQRVRVTDANKLKDFPDFPVVSNAGARA